jgi:nucleoside-diphosphate-sugar epimerase
MQFMSSPSATSDSAPASPIIIAGCGYVGRRLARRLQREGRAVGALVRTQQSIEDLTAAGIRAVSIDLDDARGLKGWSANVADSIIVYLIPPPRDGESDTRVQRFLHSIKGIPRAVIYFSTTGVYGDTEGEEVDEASPVNPMTERAHRRVSAENIVRVWCTERGVRRVVLRVPGIYGPHRLPLDRLQRSEPAVMEAEAGISNRIHLDDLVQATMLSITGDVRGIYNVTDGNGCSGTQYLKIVAELAGLAPPPEISLDEARLTMPASRLSFLEESRRVSNRRVLIELPLKLTYADLREGIRASLDEEARDSTPSSR